jgi:hypothetical protein
VVTTTLLGLWGFAFSRPPERRFWCRAAAGAGRDALRGTWAATRGLSDEEPRRCSRLGKTSIRSPGAGVAQQESQQPADSLHGCAPARAHHGIWLDRLRSVLESVSLSGSTLSPEVVPRYLRSLAPIRRSRAEITNSSREIAGPARSAPGTGLVFP